MDDLTLYDYEHPGHLIAERPLQEREAARLLVVERSTGRIEHRTVRDLPDLLRESDCLVLNDTRVVPARLFGRRAATGGRWEGLFLGVDDAGRWKLTGQTRGRLRPGEQIVLTPPGEAGSAEELRLTLTGQETDGIWTAVPALTTVKGWPGQSAACPGAANSGASLRSSPGHPPGAQDMPDSSDLSDSVLRLLAEFGTVPLPPYIRRPPVEADRHRYQTTFARRPGAVAAPTAGLHFTPELLARCEERGISHAFVTLHVGIGTFRPVTSQRLSGHRMHAEWCEVSVKTAEAVNRARQSGGRVVAVGTTAVRTLETAARSGRLEPWRGETDLFIRPPYRFRAVDALLTNFHLPKSTLLVLVAAFLGLDNTLAAYRAAIREEYRFYSYGDAMLVLERS